MTGDKAFAAQQLVAAVEAARVTRNGRQLAEAIAALVSWIRQGSRSRVDDVHGRWLASQSAFVDLDLSIWNEDKTGIDTLALALADLDYYRQVDLSVEARIDVLSQVRALLSPRHYLACARVDMERAELLSMRNDPAEVAAGLSLCDDALASIEQLGDPVELAHALLARARILFNSERVRESIVEAEKARQLYAERDATHSLAHISRFMAEVNVQRSRIPEAAVLAAEAIAGYERVGDSVGKALSLRVRARTWQKRGQRPKALQDCQEAVRLLDIACVKSAQGRVMLLMAELENDAGRFDEGQRALEAAVEYLRESPERVAFLFAVVRLADTLRRRNAVEAAAARLDEAEASCVGGETLPRQSNGGALGVMNDRDRLTLSLEICRIAKEMPTPEKPRIRRVSAVALEIARALANAEAESFARSFAAYARA